MSKPEGEDRFTPNPMFGEVQDPGQPDAERALAGLVGADPDSEFVRLYDRPQSGSFLRIRKEDVLARHELPADRVASVVDLTVFVVRGEAEVELVQVQHRRLPIDYLQGPIAQTFSGAMRPFSESDIINPIAETGKLCPENTVYRTCNDCSYVCTADSGCATKVCRDALPVSYDCPPRTLGKLCPTRICP